jgi:hypothetical protein
MTKPICTINFSINERDYESTLYPIRQKPPEFAEQLSPFYSLWRTFLNENKLPKRSDLTFEVLQGWHSNIRIVNLGTEVTADKRNIILGELYKRYWGDKTMIEQIKALGDSGKNAFKGYDEFLSCFYKGHYGVNVGYVPDPNGSMKKLIWMDLPLSSDGHQIDHMVTALLPYDEKYLK